MRFFIGLIGMIIGFLLVWQANWIVQNFGRIDWAERHISPEGGSRLLIKMIGILIIFISLLFMFGMLESIITGIFSPLYGNR